MAATWQRTWHYFVWLLVDRVSGNTKWIELGTVLADS